ncbi:hypothetical protein ACFOON_09225 [Novosphingobium piscinae]|uniref:Homogentisate 1,2-dioxygenase n=1 Tax=Novosphingobium piscinae TaxID=1507448 RepID=A0A7X1FZ96_9SPHN|nr:hypothetical protein [Novosphingobium piscinae]MBC2669142.1 hypothetical protein [Novosphingobium piscinae]
MLPLLLSLAAPLAATAAPAPTTTPAPAAAACPAVPAPLPADLAAWRAAPTRAGSLRLGQPATMALTAMAEPEAGYGGNRPLIVPQTGTYRVLLSDAAWIDVLAAGVTLQSSGHTHGPACSGIRKIVSFQLPAGRYTVRLRKSPVAQVRILVAPE